MNQKLLLTSILCMCICFAWGQNCPPSTDKHKHTVQTGETLFAIARKYGVSLADIRKWNNMQEQDRLLACANIWVTNPANKANTPKTEVAASETRPNPRDEVTTGFLIPSNEVHVVQASETVASIARKYGYTEERLRAMNNLPPKQVVKPGQELLVTGCGLCGKTAANSPQSNPKPTNTPTNKPTSEKPVSTTKPVVTTAVTPGNYEDADILKLIELNESYNGGTYFPKVVHVVSQGESLGLIAQLYGMSEAEVISMNGLQKGSQIFEGQKLLLEDRKEGNWEPIHTSEFVDPNSVSVEETFPVSSDNNLPSVNVQPIDNEPTVEVENFPTETAVVSPNSAMSVEELSMLDEINLLRRNPKGYVPFIDAYIKELQAKNNASGIVAAKELIVELKKTAALSVLTPKDCMYEALQKHGQEQMTRGSLNHEGLDGTLPWDRLMRECPEIQDGNENLIGGPEDIRKIIILLLVDDGIDSRGHRQILLNSDWKYGVCNKIGGVGEMLNCWGQAFGY